MDLTSLSTAHLEKALLDLQATGPEGAKAVDHLQQALNELQVHRMELEMQNRALRESQTELGSVVRRYTDLYDYSPIGYLTLSPSGRIEEANLTAAELLQTDRSCLVGRYFTRFLDAGDVTRFHRHLEDALAGGPSVAEATLRIEPHHTLPVQLSSREANGAGARLVRTTITDVSQLKAVQQQLLDANREQETFSYSISHDLRTPLVTISNLATLLLSESAENLDEMGKDCLRRIHFASSRMDQLLTDLLEYSRVSRSALRSETVEVEKVLDDVLGQHHGAIEEAKGKVTVHRPLPRVEGSPEALRQVLANLLTNALKFVRPGDRPQVEFAGRVEEQRAILTVRDHGIGIPEEHRQRVFAMFERLHGQNQYPGTGIGLAIVRRAAERMGGRIWVEFELGKGSTFFVELPVALSGP